MRDDYLGIFLLCKKIDKIKYFVKVYTQKNMTNRSKKSYIKYIPPIDISYNNHWKPKPDISGHWLHFDISGHHHNWIDISCVVVVKPVKPDISGHHHNWIDISGHHHWPDISCVVVKPEKPDISGHHHHHWPIKPSKKSKSSTK